MSDETLVEHLEQIIDDCVSPKVAAHASLLVVADAVEEAYRVAGPGDIEAHLQPAAHWIRAQAAEEGARDD